MYSPAVPFKSPWVLHSVKLDHPPRPTNLTWLHNTPHVSEDTEHLVLAVDLHPDIPHCLCVAGDLRLPNTLKRVIIDLNVIPVNGVKRPTLEAFRALGHFWIKVFYNRPPGVQFHIYNIHQWDSVQHLLPMRTRQYLATLFCTMTAPHMTRLTAGEKARDIAGPLLKFVRGQCVLSDGETRMLALDPDAPC